MSSTNKTTQGFNKWILEDKPQMADFNADNALTDQLLGDRYTKEEADEKFAPLTDALLKLSGGTVTGLTNFTGGLQIGGENIVEYGRWTPTSTTFNITSSWGIYYRIGKFVCCSSLAVVGSILNMSGDAAIFGLPFRVDKASGGSLLRAPVLQNIGNACVRTTENGIQFLKTSGTAIKGSECITGNLEFAAYYIMG